MECSFTCLDITPWGVAVHGFHGNVSVKAGVPWKRLLRY